MLVDLVVLVRVGWGGGVIPKISSISLTSFLFLTPSLLSFTLIIVK